MKIVRIIQKLLTAAVFAVVILIIVSALPIPGNYKLMVVQSGSMEPAIKTGSVVAVMPSDSYQINEVITFSGKDKNKSTTHRIADMEVISGKIYYITKGDANNAEDTDKVSRDKVIGKVLFSVPYAGYAVAAAKEPLGFVLLVIIPCAIIIFEEAGKIYKEIKKKKVHKIESP